jgi:hypothetical protein
VRHTRQETADAEFKFLSRVIQTKFRENPPNGSKYIMWDRQMDVKNLSQAYLSLILEILKALNVNIVTPFSHNTVTSFGTNGNYPRRHMPEDEEFFNSS